MYNRHQLEVSSHIWAIYDSFRQAKELEPLVKNIPDLNYVYSLWSKQVYSYFCTKRKSKKKWNPKITYYRYVG